MEKYKSKRIKILIILSVLILILVILIGAFYAIFRPYTWDMFGAHGAWSKRTGKKMQGLLEDMSHINYSELADRYKNVISREEFYAVRGGEELHELYELINSVEVELDPLTAHFVEVRGFKTPITYGFIEYNEERYSIEYEVKIRPTLFGMIIEEWKIYIHKMEY
jgi:hypothetical protein